MTFAAVLVIVVLLFVAILVLRSSKLAPTADPAGRMQLWKAVLLLAYLSAAAVVAGYLVYSLWVANPKLEAHSKPEPSCAGEGNPDIQSVDPDAVYIGSGRDTVRVLGCHFKDTDKVFFDGGKRETDYTDPQHLIAHLKISDFTVAHDIAVSVGREGVASNKSQTLQIKSASDIPMEWYVRSRHWTINEEVRLILLILFTGAFGSSLYALKSFADYIGTRKLNESWFTFYIIQPLEGAGIAFIFYVLMRGGFLAGTGADVKSVNPFGVSAIAVLVGVFSDKAFQKLGEIFETLFKSTDDRGDKINKTFHIATNSKLPPATVGQDYKQQLEATNGSPPYEWTITPALPPGLSLDKVTGLITGKPTQASLAGSYTVTAKDSAKASATGTIELTVK